MKVPEDRRYTADHEWAMADSAGVRVGVTDFAQQALGDVVFVALPRLGDEVAAGGSLGEVESTKSVSDVFAPVAGTVAAVNGALADSPGYLNDDPYGQGWICVITPSDPEALDGLLSATDYQALVTS
ncbi:MAG: glycine cleavage system protein GcvH [Acidimicrobiales bacterium]